MDIKNGFVDWMEEGISSVEEVEFSDTFRDTFPKYRNHAVGFYGGVQFAKSELEDLATKIYENRFEPDKIEILTREYRRKR